MRISDWSSDVCSSDLADMLVCNNGCWTLDEATTLFDGEAKVQPDALADLMYASLFCYSDDCGHDRRDSQSLEFERDRKRVVAGKSVAVRVVLRGSPILRHTNNETHISYKREHT